MIESLSFLEGEKSKFPYARNIEYFKASPVTTFKPGLNIVYGPNGSGKSTLLKLLGLSLAAVQGGVSTVTQTWISDTFDWGSKAFDLPCTVVHDGQPVMYYDAREVAGLFAGAAFDDDFFSLGVDACIAKGSVGELNMHRLTRHLNVLIHKGEGFPAEVAWKYPRTSTHADIQAKLALIDQLFEARCAKGPRTLLFDEPESGFSMPWQAGMWRNIFGKVDPEQFQVIVATHSPFALRIPGAHYIEMHPGYASECFVTLMAELMDKAPGLFARPGPVSESVMPPEAKPTRKRKVPTPKTKG